MLLSEYLNQRTHHGHWVKALSHAEAKIAGIPWPLRKGWPTEFANLEVDGDAMRAAVSARLLRRQQAKAERNALTDEVRRRAKMDKKVRRYEKKEARKVKKQIFRKATSDSFLASYEWRVARMKVLKRDGARCCCCGATPDDGVRMHVDHIKPRRTHPELALDLDNLQVLCSACNHGKGNWDSTDWRKKPAANDEEEQTAHIRSIVHG